MRYPARAATREEYARAQTLAASAGEFFVPRASASGTRPVEEFSAAELRDRGSRTAERLGTGELRVGVSTWQFALQARLASICLGMAVAGNVVPDLTGVRLGEDTQPFLPHARGWYAETEAQAAELLGQALLEPGASLNQAIAQATGVSVRLLQGNLAAALTGAMRVLERAGIPVPRGTLEPVLSDPRIGETLQSDYPSLRRRTCCLFYRVAGGGYCGDCPLAS